jgi:hypothetical protein
MQSLKSLLVTLIILGGAFLAYDYYLAPDADKMVFKKPAPVQPAPQQLPPTPEDKPAEVVMPTTPTPPPAMPPAPIVPVAPPPPPPAPVVTDGFVAPVIPDIVQATQNWTRIPLSAFPRVVKLSKPVAFKASFGSTQVAAGAEVTAMAVQNGTLTVAPNAASSLRGTVAMDDTNLKTVLTGLYDAWRAKRVEQARYAWEHRNDTPAAEPPKPVAASSDGKPEQAPDGTYPLLMASMKTGQVTEVTPFNITKWGSAEQAEFRGEKCWNVTIDYTADTAFGKFPGVAVAKVVGGRVAGWFYRDSGEVIP